MLQSGEKTKDILFTSKAGQNSFDLKTINQSGGTIAFLEKTRILYDLIYGYDILLFDEPENDLHYDLFLFYLNAFLYNSDKSQMIIASHLTSLLAEDIINEQRDLIYFVEKDIETATNTVFTRTSLSTMHTRLESSEPSQLWVHLSSLTNNSEALPYERDIHHHRRMSY